MLRLLGIAAIAAGIFTLPARHVRAQQPWSWDSWVLERRLIRDHAVTLVELSRAVDGEIEELLEHLGDPTQRRYIRVRLRALEQEKAELAQRLRDLSNRHRVRVSVS
jgi:hypothetical protein